MYKQRLICTLLGGLLMTGMANAQTCTNTAMVESTPTSGFTFNAGGTVTHNATGLMWKRCLEGQTFADNGTPSNYLDDKCTGTATGLNWQAALNKAQTANGANDSGHNDWRVPNHKELTSIVEFCRTSPAINTEVFPGSSSSAVWSSSPGAESNAWRVPFNNSYDYGFWDNRDRSLSVRLVRSGQ